MSVQDAGPAGITPRFPRQKTREVLSKATGPDLPAGARHCARLIGRLAPTQCQWKKNALVDRIPPRVTGCSASPRARRAFRIPRWALPSFTKPQNRVEQEENLE